MIDWTIVDMTVWIIRTQECLAELSISYPCCLYRIGTGHDRIKTSVVSRLTKLMWVFLDEI